MNPHANQFIKKLSHPLRFKFFLFWKLPSAFFSGLAIRQLNTERAEITVPYKWLLNFLLPGRLRQGVIDN